MTDQAERAAFRDKWALEIGRFVMAFGAIEGMTIAMIRSNFEKPVAELLLASELGKRLKLLIAICEANAGGWKAVAKVLKEVETLAKKRNLIAHSGVSLDVYLSPTNRLSIKHAIRSHRAPKESRKLTEARYLILFDELAKLRSDAEDLDDRLLTVVRAATEAE